MPSITPVNNLLATKPLAYREFNSRFPNRCNLSEFMHQVTNELRLHPAIIKILDAYYLLYWNGKHLREANSGGVIKREGREFVIIFKDCTPVVAYRSANCRLSFRVIPEWISNCNYCIVSVKQSLSL